ncbi:isoprenoid synthase domain-containing protein [Dactylonectria macrodidyma]|uniref:Terpene synthase n=1 Tax=Dactylonectria macrodidyma TaxID=307937 RepID=A0A9P9JH35_9HYPO|nr:isoprenoid synthase domain-containing protein [Dactylonectria macrodidyma]
MKQARLDQDAIVAALKGRTLRVPDLTSFFGAWPPAELHPRRAAVVASVVDAALGSHPSLARRRDDDIASLVSLWYPRAADRDIEALALYAVWLVCWDDTVDEGEGDLAGDFDGAERWRSQTLDVVRAALQIDGTGADKDSDVINAVFRDFGDRLSQAAPIEQRQALYEEIRFFIASCGVEQQLRLEKHIPDYDTYMDFRLGTIGGAMLCSLIEFANGEPLPARVSAAPQTRALWTHVCTLLTFVNDLLSLKKELRTDCVINAVTALLAPSSDGGLDGVVAELQRKISRAVDDFDVAARELLGMVEGGEAQRGVVARYIDGCRAIVTGTLRFTLQSPRYNIAKLLKDDGTLEIVL